MSEDEPTSYSDENAKHLPMKRRYLDTKVLVLPASARKRRPLHRRLWQRQPLAQKALPDDNPQPSREETQ